MVIEVDGLTKRFGPVVAVESLSKGADTYDGIETNYELVLESGGGMNDWS